MVWTLVIGKGPIYLGSILLFSKLIRTSIPAASQKDEKILLDHFRLAPLADKFPIGNGLEDW
jgi:hypothetical protein